MPISLLLAWRFLKSSRDEKSISVMIKICFISILLSTFALTLVAAIMNGYEHATHEKLKGIHADVIITARGKSIDFKKLKEVIDTEFQGIVACISPVALSQVIIQGNKESTTLCVLKGIDPLLEPQVSALKTMITTSSLSWDELLQGNTIFIGEKLSQQLGVSVGDTITILYGDDILNNKITFQSQQARIAALFKTGINEFDEYVILSSLSLFTELFSQGISQVNVKLALATHEKKALTMLKSRFPLEVSSWKDLYPALVSALALEKYAMFIILSLVILVASMNIVSLLFMFVTQKQGDIALLKSMGIADMPLMGIFIILGLCITLTASLCGIFLALGASWFLRNYPLIYLPDIYYVSHLPVYIDTSMIGMVLSITTVLSFLATLLPAYKIKHITVAQVLKNGLP